MRAYLLDTGVMAAYLLGRPRFVRLLSSFMGDDQSAMSIICYGEIYEYLQSRGDFAVAHNQLMELFNLGAIYLYNLDLAIMVRYAQIRRTLRRGSGLIGDADTLIAATAMEHDLTLVTLDGDFQRVPGLKLQVVPRQQP
jgi:predicted nucleic acid-binding protein